jgi:hypothetical protein
VADASPGFEGRPGHPTVGGPSRSGLICAAAAATLQSVCVYYCSTYYKAGFRLAPGAHPSVTSGADVCFWF